MCRQPFRIGATREFRLGQKRWFTCTDCAPLVEAGATAAAEGLQKHVLPAVASVVVGAARKAADRVLESRPLLRTLLEGAWSRYEEGNRGNSRQG